MHCQKYSARAPHAGPTEDDRDSITAGRLQAVALMTVLAAGSLLMLGGCARTTGSEIDVSSRGGTLFVVVDAGRDTVMQSISHVLAQERIALRRYEPENGYAETGFFDIAEYTTFDEEIWDDTERLIKMRFDVTARDTTTLLRCQPFYNPYEVVTDELDEARLRPVPAGHPGFEVAAALTRRMAALAEGKAVVAP